MGVAPFKPGDKVVCVSGESVFDPEEIYTISECWFCCNNEGYRANVYEVPFVFTEGNCCGCNSTHLGWWASNFRKVDSISDTTMDSLLEELCEPTVKEAEYV